MGRTIHTLTVLFTSPRPIISALVPASVPLETYQLHLMRGVASDQPPHYLLNYGFSSYDIVCLGVCALLGLWYLIKKVGHLEFYRLVNDKFEVIIYTKCVPGFICSSVHANLTVYS